MYSSVTDICTVDELDAMILHIESHVPQSRSPHWTPGWRGESEAALLDAIFSARAAYGGPTSGVRAVVQRWRSHRGDNRLDDLTTLAELTTTPDLPWRFCPTVNWFRETVEPRQLLQPRRHRR